MSAPVPAELPPRRSGPLDGTDWPEHLTARVLTTGPEPRIHGYDVEGDLSRHYTWTETILLALTGVIPSAQRARALEIALQFLSPVPINEAPTHATVVARICNVFTSALVGTAAVGLGEQARQAVSLAVEAGASTPSEADRASVDRLRLALRHAGLSVPGIDGDVGRMQALLSILTYAGLGQREQQEVVIVLARLPCVLAEALATPSHSYRDYPVRLPDVRYTEAP